MHHISFISIAVVYPIEGIKFNGYFLLSIIQDRSVSVEPKSSIFIFLYCSYT